jgi:hypothetical protein
VKRRKKPARKKTPKPVDVAQWMREQPILAPATPHFDLGVSFAPCINLRKPLPQAILRIANAAKESLDALLEHRETVPGMVPLLDGSITITLVLATGEKRLCPAPGIQYQTWPKGKKLSKTQWARLAREFARGAGALVPATEGGAY